MRAIDLFAGWGGMTEGATAAGAHVVWAANHWPLAVAAHRAAHPEAVHVCQDLRQADWSTVPVHDVMLAAPACQGHSTASQPKRRGYHDALRATAWAVVDCADVCEPAALVVENVPAFKRWRLYPQWRAALEAIGYTLAELELTASDFGVPQRRTRLFIVGVKSGPAFKLAPLRQPGELEPAAGQCVDWTAGRWRRVADAAPGARARIAASRHHGRRFFSQHVTGHRGVSLAEPLRTVTTKDQWVIVDGDRYRPLTVRETARMMGFGDHYGWPADATRRDVMKGLGNAVCPPVAAAIVGGLQARLG